MWSCPKVIGGKVGCDVREFIEVVEYSDVVGFVNHSLLRVHACVN